MPSPLSLTSSLCRAAQAAAAALCLVAPAAIAQDDVPFVTTPDAVTLAMLELAGVTARDHVVDLGSGDGRIVITAARRFGASGLGVEIVPDLVAASRERARARPRHAPGRGSAGPGRERSRRRGPTRRSGAPR